ncbi:MAG: LrgB family protein [Spirochaetaceae bacterium]|jgi:putative effector of murein hydrolase|nr:LrgB family protein [Spirochaetaceae bacterium]
MAYLISLPVVGIIITILCYFLGIRANKLFPSPLTSPMVIANGLIILIICLTPLTIEQYLTGGNMITLFIVPATTLLSLRIYRQWALLKANVIPILSGCIAGSVASMASTFGLCKLFSIDTGLIVSLLPKSVTTAIALELATKNGGFSGVAISGVIITGVFSAAFGPFFIKNFKLRDPVAGGVAMGASGHAIGTAAALEIGEVYGAMGGIAIGLMGIITSLLFLFVPLLF